jgi:hypothetical protein
MGFRTDTGTLVTSANEIRRMFRRCHYQRQRQQDH